MQNTTFTKAQFGKMSIRSVTIGLELWNLFTQIAQRLSTKTHII